MVVGSKTYPQVFMMFDGSQSYTVVSQVPMAIYGSLHSALGSQAFTCARLGQCLSHLYLLRVKREGGGATDWC